MANNHLGMRAVTPSDNSVERLKAAFVKVLFFVAVALILTVLVLPTVIVIPVSFGENPYLEFPPVGFTLKWYWEFFNDADWIRSLAFSVQIAIATTVAATIIGAMAAIALERGDLPGKAVFQGLALSPLIVPHIIIAIALYIFFAPLKLNGNFVGFLIAHTLLAVPYVVITVSAALQRFDGTLELAALNLGANRFVAFFTVVLPNIKTGVLAGAIFAFVSSFDEATVAFFISGVNGKTITRKLFEDIDYNLTPVIAVVATVLVAVTLMLMCIAQVLRNSPQR